MRTVRGLDMPQGKSEIVFEVTQDELDGYYTAVAHGHEITAQAKSVKELRDNVREACSSYFGSSRKGPGIIRLLYIRDEYLSV